MEPLIFRRIISITVILTIPSILILGCPSGAPQVPIVCSRMMPNHGVPSQKGPSPYTLTLDKEKVKPGQEVRLTVSGAPLKGYLIQARKIHGPFGLGMMPVGSFLGGQEEEGMQTLNCAGLKGSAVTHKTNEERGQVTVTWVAPDVVGVYRFLVTSVQSAATFWVAQNSPNIEVVYCA